MIPIYHPVYQFYQIANKVIQLIINVALIALLNLVFYSLTISNANTILVYCFIGMERLIFLALRDECGTNTLKYFTPHIVYDGLENFSFRI